MLTFIHTADVHLGARLLKLGERVEEQRVQIQLTFEKLIKEAINRNVSLVLIAGDLFDDQKPDKNLLEFAITNMIALNDRHIHVCLSLGTHDFATAQLIDRAADLTQFPFIHIFDEASKGKIELSDIQTVVFSAVPDSNRTTQSPLAGIMRDDNFQYNIAMAHGSVQIPGKSSSNDSPITLDEIENSGMEYVALGHWHNQQEVGRGKVKAWYSGAPEMIDLDQANSGKFLVITINDSKEIYIESVQIGKRVFDTVTIDASTITGFEDLLGKIKSNATPDTVRLVSINGILSPDVGIIDDEEIKRRLKNDLFTVIVKNNSKVSIEDIDKQSEGNILKTTFISYIRQSDKESELINEALQLGLALIDGQTKI